MTLHITIFLLSDGFYLNYLMYHLFSLDKNRGMGHFFSVSSTRLLRMTQTNPYWRPWIVKHPIGTNSIKAPSTPVQVQTTKQIYSDIGVTPVTVSDTSNISQVIDSIRFLFGSYVFLFGLDRY